MKKHILILALVTAMIGTIVSGCGSANKASSSDTTMKDTTKMMDTSKKMMDTTMKKDTSKMDTTKKM